MGDIINIHEAKTHLSRLLERVQSGEEITIARAGTPIARLTRIDGPPRPRVPGRDRIVVRADIDDPLPGWAADDMHPQDPLHDPHS
jgi:prevent-host-death family protein